MVMWLLAGGAVVLYLASNKDKGQGVVDDERQSAIDAHKLQLAAIAADPASSKATAATASPYLPHSPTTRTPPPAPGGAAGVAAATGIAGLAAATHQQQNQVVNVMPAPRPPTFVPPSSWGLEGKGMALNNVSRSLYP